MNPYDSSNTEADLQLAGQAKVDRRTTFAFWLGLLSGALTWLCLGLGFRYGMEALYIGPPPWYAYAFGPGIIVFGLASIVLMAYGYDRRRKNPEHRWSPTRFVIAGVPCSLPVLLVLFSWLDRVT